MNPAAGAAFLEYIGHGRQIDKVQAAFVLGNIPTMGVPEEIGFYMPARTQYLQQFVCVLQRLSGVGAAG